MKVAFTDQDAEIVAEWLQKSRTIMGRVVMRPVEGGRTWHGCWPRACCALAKSGALTDEPLSATLKRIADLIESEAALASRAGQHDRLMAIAAEIREELLSGEA